MAESRLRFSLEHSEVHDEAYCEEEGRDGR
jgi:hypothetical protein